MPCTQWLLFKCSVHSSSRQFSFRLYFQGDCIPYSDNRQPRSFWSQEIFWESFSSEWFTVSCPVPSLIEKKFNDLKANALQCLWMETATFLPMQFWSIILPFISNIFWDASNRIHDLRSICWKLVTPDTLQRWILLFMPWYPPSVKLEQFPMCK